MSRELRAEAHWRRHEREALDRKREEFARDLRAVATTAEGRRFLGWLLERANLFRNDYLPGTAGAYAAGQRAAALELWERLRGALPRDAFMAIALPEEADAGDGDEAREEPYDEPEPFF